jgi:CheY-like chemotaxis protein
VKILRFAQDDRASFIFAVLMPQPLAPKPPYQYPIPMPDALPRVMFVEDESTLRKSYERFFADRYDMEFAASGAEAVTKVGPFAPEVVVLDLRLPDTDGIEVMRQVREINPQVPVIITTAYVSMGPLVSMLALGRTSFMTKPFDLNDLARKIDEASTLP